MARSPAAVAAVTVGVAVEGVGECRGDGGACIHEFVKKLCTKLDKCSGM